jgi:glycosyltransferase involved in cell wall biosynthesis
MRDESRLGHGKFNVQLATDTPVGISAEDVCKKRNCAPPSVVWDGFGSYSGMVRSYSWLKENNSKLVRTVGDVEVHTGEYGIGHPEFNSKVYVDALFWPGVEDTPAVNRCKAYTEDLITQEDAKYICIPFGVDTRKFRPNKDKDIDVIAVYMMESGSPWQQYRMAMAQVLVAMMKDPMKKYKDLKFHIGNEFYEHYPEFANRSKMALVDTSQRDYMTAKYLEYGASGALLIGDQPKGYEDWFNSSTMSVVDQERMAHELPAKILEYHEHEDERIKKTEKMRKVIELEFSLPRIAERIEKAFLGLMG